ncbi:MAG: hydrolase [Chloroflexi bacterium]|nr:MAG: hydrolase [Chloroflexota bacterium]
MAKYPCPCCGFLTLDEKPPGTYYICPVCFWEDDRVQFDDPDYRGGANRGSLREARENYRRIGAIDENSLRHVRAPLADEVPPSSKVGSDE